MNFPRMITIWGARLGAILAGLLIVGSVYSQSSVPPQIQKPSAQPSSPSQPKKPASAGEQPGKAPSRAPVNDASIPEQQAAISKLDKMVGTWRGAGWAMLGPGQRSEFTQTEVVQKKLDGTLLIVEGDGRAKDNPGKHVHDAFAVLSYDPAGQRYTFAAYSGGRHLEEILEITEVGFRWGFDMPYGKVRFTLDFSSTKWHEIGEFSRDSGQTWLKNFEMELRKE